MIAPDVTSEVFIVRIWRESREIAGADPSARGVVEHIGSGARCYVTDLEEIASFIAPFTGMGVRHGARARIRRWRQRIGLGVR
jgi:hypothetical protein